MKVLEGLRAARKMARERAFALGARPEKLILDVNATLVGSHSDKEHARGNYKGGASGFTRCSATWTAQTERSTASSDRATPGRTPVLTRPRRSSSPCNNYRRVA